MPRAGPRKLHRYSDAFKLTAVRLSQQPGIRVQTVAAALEIHPFMLSKWRRDAKEGRLRGRRGQNPPRGLAREVAQLASLERKYATLQEEHELLKKAIRFWAARGEPRVSGSPSSTTSSRNATGFTSPRSVGATRSRAPGSTLGGRAARARMPSRTGR